MNLVSQALKSIITKCELLESRYQKISDLGQYQFVSEKQIQIWEPVFFLNLKNVVGLSVDELDLEADRVEQLMSQLNYGFKVVQNLERVPNASQKGLSLSQ